ncbi:hypothetical protein [Streptomyces sp. OP7]|uniref:hypothetical protein n=1 Tax=Streptomyces sp. OP7 TaxID=3142462 RepID=UPI0032E8F7E6
MLRVLAVLLLACFAMLGTDSVGHAAEGDLVKVFVVPDPEPVSGQTVTLGTIAARTLGDASRAAEIFDLNRGLRQPDGASLNGPEDRLLPGWILRLPPDASGPDVRQARDTGQAGSEPDPSAGGTTHSIPLATAVAASVAVLLALTTAGIVGRRKVRAVSVAVGRWMWGLGAPARRRRRLKLRRGVGRHFAEDADTPRRAYDTVGQLAGDGKERAVHALRIDRKNVTVWLEESESPGSPWSKAEGSRWRRPADTRVPSGWRPDDTTADAAPGAACLVRAGTDEEGEPVFVDLSRLDGILSLTGDADVARDTVQNLLAEVARTRPNTPVTVLSSEASRTARLTVPAGLMQLPSAELRVTNTHTVSQGTLRAAALRRPVQGLVVATGAPTDRQLAELAALCGPGGAGWTGLVCGDVAGAHWRWHAHADGRVDLPVLDISLTVPA